jgi:putative ABC transport system substrate-binding protein
LAQHAERTYRICWLTPAPRSEPYNIAFEQRLRELGFVEGRNLVIEFRTAEGRLERLPELAADLARQNCETLLASGSEATLVAIKQAIELLKELLPRPERIAVFSDTAPGGQLQAVQAAAKRLGIALKVLEFKRQPYDYETAFAELIRAKAEALMSLASANFIPGRRKISELVLKHRLPSMFNNAVWVENGALPSYGPSFLDFFRRAAEQVSRTLKGAKPADLPVEEADQFELAINLKTAKALGIMIQ